jgi:hypothetical protein
MIGTRQFERGQVWLQTAKGRERRALRAGQQTADSHQQPIQRLHRFAAVVLQQSAQPLLTADISERNDRFVGFGVVQPLGSLVSACAATHSSSG